MPLGFLNYKGVLNEYVIPDLSNIIIGYISHYVEMFDNKFISECIKTGHYLYYNKNNTTLLHYLFQKERLYYIKDLLKNSNYLRAKHFQNKNEDGETELYLLCYHRMHTTIALITSSFRDGTNKNKVFDNAPRAFWKPEHFQNKDKDGITELYWLCQNKMHSTIALVASNFVGGANEDKVFDNVKSTFWKPEHFQNKNTNNTTELYLLCYYKMHSTIDLVKHWKPKHFQNKNKNGETELYWLCQNEMHTTIALVASNFVGGANEDKVFDNVKSTFWKPEHFQNKNTNNTTELYLLCYYKMHSTIDLVKHWKPKHFQNKNKNGETELYLLCQNKMHSTIALVTSNFVGGAEDKVFDNMQSTFWKPEHFQNKDRGGITELYWLCQKKMHSTIALVTSNFVGGAENKVFDNMQSTFWKPEHFQNKNINNTTELYWLCYNKMHTTIDLVTSSFVNGSNEDKVFDNVQSTFWKPEHFQNKNICGRTELYLLCIYKMHSTIALITSNFVNGDNKNKVFGNVQSTFWKPEHFQNKDINNTTELYWLCYNRMHATIALVTSSFVDGDRWKPEHFQNKDIAGGTELYQLCYKKMHLTIALVIGNFVDSANEDKVFDNAPCTFWKLEHCNSYMERNYMYKYNFI